MAFVTSSGIIRFRLGKQKVAQNANRICESGRCVSRFSRRAEIVCQTSGKQSRRFKPGKGAPVQKVKPDPEETFMETGPSWTELIVPTVSILTVIGIIPFVAALCRQAWVKYKLTTRRISISSGFQGKDLTEIIYRDISAVNYVRRLAGTGDMVISLKDGAKVELRNVPEMDKMFNFIMGKVDEKVKEQSGAA